jgi:hypothetical protein
MPHPSSSPASPSKLLGDLSPVRWARASIARVQALFSSGVGRGAALLPPPPPRSGAALHMHYYSGKLGCCCLAAAPPYAARLWRFGAPACMGMGCGGWRALWHPQLASCSCAWGAGVGGQQGVSGARRRAPWRGQPQRRARRAARSAQPAAAGTQMMWGQHSPC